MAGIELSVSRSDLARRCYKLWGGYRNKNERFKLSADQEELRKEVIAASLREPAKFIRTFSFPHLLYNMKTTNEDHQYEGLIEEAGLLTWTTYWGILSNEGSLDLYKIKSDKLEISKSISPICGSHINTKEKNKVKLTVKIDNKVYKFRTYSNEECQEWEKQLRDVSEGNMNLSPGESVSPFYENVVDNNIEESIKMQYGITNALLCYNQNNSNSPPSENQNNSNSPPTQSPVDCSLGTGSRSLDPQLPLIEDLLRNVYLVCIGFLTIGMGSLLPWNFFIAAESYWQYKLRNISDTTRENGTMSTQLQQMWYPLQVCTSKFSYFIFLIISTFFFSKVRQSFRVLGPMACMVIFFVVNIIFVNINTDKCQILFVVCTVVIILIMNMCTAVLVSNLHGIAGLFPTPFVMIALLSGESIGGIVAALARIISLVRDPGDIDNVTLDTDYYFLIAIAVLLISSVIYIKMSGIDFYREFASFRPIGEESFKQQLMECFAVFKKIPWTLTFSVFWLSFITISFYPSLCIMVKSTDITNWGKVFFQPVITFLLFNICDLIGRFLAGFCFWGYKTNIVIFSIAILRTVFIILFLFCNNKISLTLGYDNFYISLIVAFALTNGYPLALCMVYAPRYMKAARYKMCAGFIMAAIQGFGLLLGGFASVLLDQIK